MRDIMRTSIAPARASMLRLVLLAAIAMVMVAAREMVIRMTLAARPSAARRMGHGGTA